MNTKKHVTVILAGFILIASLYACSKSSNSPEPPPPAGNTTTINVTGMSFPATTTVAKGATVVWHNGDSMAHTVTSDDGTTFNSGIVAAGASYTFVANNAGTFAYHCNVHPGMTGSLVVTP